MLTLHTGAGGCGSSDASPDAVAAFDAPSTGVDARVLAWSMRPSLPEPVSNNAVAAIRQGEDCELFSMTGIGAGLGAADIHVRSWRLPVDAGAWQPIDDAPGEPRIAASAVTLRGRVHLLGGYSVAAGGDETTRDTHAVFDPTSGQWSLLPPLPVPIDDAVAAVWRDRWIVVVSGWSNTDSVSAVQLYDADSNQWFAATEFPGSPVFGHAGAIVGDRLVIADGVASTFAGFELVNQLWVADLNANAPAQITWTDLGPHQGPARYRAAAGAWQDAVWFAGGTTTPYNYDGLRYDNGQPAAPMDSVSRFANGAMTDEPGATASMPSMDHRGLLDCGPTAVVVGGLQAGPLVSTDVWMLIPQQPL